MKKFLLSCFFLLYFSLLHLLHAQNFRYTQYTTNEGLPSDNVYCAAQDNHGFMYFGTDFGLVRYDGFRFNHYSTNDGLINKPVTDMVYAGGDSIIFASYPDALQSIHSDGRIDTIVKKNNSLTSIQLIAKQGTRFYIYYRTIKEFAVLEKGLVTKFSLDTIVGVSGSAINCIIPFNEDMVFCTAKGLFLVNKNKNIQLIKGENIYQALVSSSGQLIVAGEKSIYFINDHSQVSISSAKLPADFKTLNMGEDVSGGTWFRGQDKGIYRLSDNMLMDMAPGLQIRNQSVNSFYKDNHNNFWLCCDGAGIIFIPGIQASVINTQDGLISNKVLRLFAQQGKVWAGTQNGLSIKEKNKISGAGLPKADASLQYVYKLFEAAPGVTGICITNIKGFDADTNKLGNLVKNTIINNQPCRIYKSWFAWAENDSISWLQETRSSPIIRININNNNRKYYDVKQFDIRKVFDAAYYNNSYWFGTDKGVLHLTGNNLHVTDSINGEKLKQVMDLFIDSKNKLWLAAEAGLFKWEDEKFISMPKASSYGGNYCTSITEDDKGNVWAATWDGILSTNGSKCIYYNTGNGLSSKIVNNILFSKTDSTLYAGTDNGITVFSKPPGAINFSQPVFIQASLSNDEKKLLPDNSVLLPSQNDLNFYLSVPFYINHKDVSYEYSLDGKAWVWQNNPELHFENLTGGKHLLKVRAGINSLGLKTRDTNFHFSIKTPFYKKEWFILVALLLLQLIIITVINHYNKKRKEKQVNQQLRQQQQMLEHASLKQQAFTSLLNPHFIFNALNSIQHFINQQDRQNANRYLSDFASLIRKTFDASQQTFIPLEAEQENLRLYLQLEKMRFGDKINYSITNAENLDPDNWMLPAMILQPFLENAILHGLMPATNNGELQIHFAQNQKHELVITIADNGIGFKKSSQLRTGKTHTSRGMQLIKERLELLGKLSGHTIVLTIADQYPGVENPGTVVTLCYSEEVYDNYMKLHQ